MSRSESWAPATEGGPLISMLPQNPLWRRWLEDQLEMMPGAGEGLEQLGLATPAGGGRLPEVYGRHLRQEVETIVPKREHRFAIQNNITALQEGRALPLVTGQQPGFAGGPLYTLLKITSVVVLARLLREEGRPAVPVFWMGDDDDDLAEALSARAWWPGQSDLLTSGIQTTARKGRPAMIGSLAGRELEGGWIRALRDADVPVVPDWDESLDQVLAEDLDLSGWTARTLWQLFGKDGLVILRGNDPRLHAGAREFYHLVGPRLETLRGRAREGRKEAVKELGCAPLAENSILRPLYQVADDHRLPSEDDALPADTAILRCGVMLRSLLQDWLLGPAAVIVGPGELNYLVQLQPLYRELGIIRSPLLPRLFGWVVPQEENMAALLDAAGKGPLDEQQAAQLAAEAAEPSRAVLEHLLTQMGISRERATSLAEGRSRRWVKGVQSMLFDESRRLQVDRRVSYPTWIFPEGARQERRLAWMPLLAVWGAPFQAAIEEAARRHWQAGQGRSWREFLVRVPHHHLSPPKGTS